MTQREIIERLSEGYIILAGPNAARLVPRPKILSTAEGFDIPYVIVEEMMVEQRCNHDYGMIGEVTEHRNNYKSGWREMGLEPPPAGQRYYLMMQ